MRTLSVVGAIALMLTGMAAAQTPFTVTYTVEVGGNNNVAAWEDPIQENNNVAFTAGQANPAAPFTTSPITWDVVAAVSGTDLEGWSIQGAANLTWNLELQTEAGAPVAGNRFLSTMNDGDDEGARHQNAGTRDPFEKAAWCLGWDVDMDYNGVLDDVFPFGTGRLFDPTTIAGPNMDRVQFPSNTFHGGGRMKGGVYTGDCNGNLVADATELAGNDANANQVLDVCENGAVNLPGTAGEALAENKLSGMGIGYSQFSVSANNLGVGLAVGSIVPQWYQTGEEKVGIGMKPAAEGQIDMTGLPTGTYKLVLTASVNANNVVPIAYVPGAAGGFAVKADVVNGDEVSFFWDAGVPPCTPVAPIAWKSTKTHGNGVGDMAIALNPTDGIAVSESRNNGLTKISVQFDGDLTAANYAAGGVVITGAGLTVSGEALATTAIANDTLVLTLTGSVDRTCYSFNVAGVVECLKPGADPTCSVLALIGDTNNDKRANLTDAAQTKSKNGIAVVAGQERFDVNIDGRLNLTDYALVKSKNNSNLVACP